MLSTVVFQIGPAIFDIAAASVYIALKLQPWIAVIVFVTLRCAGGGAACTVLERRSSAGAGGSLVRCVAVAAWCVARAGVGGGA